ncbi:MAG: FecR domain-containing protein [Acidobacteriota bacterium]|nr:FecR domain-containing protein [Acidobacteriota bacterium]
MKKAVIIVAALFALGSALSAEEIKYTNDSVARLSFLTGNTFVQRASDLGYEEGILNMPLGEGDRIGTTAGRAEIRFGRRNYLRLDNNTKLDLLSLPRKGSDLVRIRIWSGNVYLDVDTLKKEKTIEVHSTDTSFYVLDRGLYRIEVRENKDTELFVFRGLIEAAGEEGSILVKNGQRLEIAEGRFSDKPSRFMAVADDTFDKWNESRISEAGRRLPRGYLSEELEEFEYELWQAGEWIYLPPYGYVWVPNGVDSDWRPYYNGRWAWLPMTGWNWIPYEPWGWATYHYGRWHWAIGIGWYWIPTSIWGPAWVSWWWDYDYFAWAPMSYWGYPVVLLDGRFYGGYYGDRYPVYSRALTVIRKDQLKAPNVARVAMKSDALKSLNKMSLTSRQISVRPEAGNVSVQSIDGKRMILKNDGGRVSAGGKSAAGGGKTIGRSSLSRPEPAQKGGGGETKAAEPRRINDKSGREGKSQPQSQPRGGSERQIRKKDNSSAALGPLDSGGSRARAASSFSARANNAGERNVYGYPSSPRISRRSIYGSGDVSLRSGYRNSYYRSLAERKSAGRSGSGSQTRISSPSSASPSRGSSPSHSGSPRSSGGPPGGGGVHRKN